MLPVCPKPLPATIGILHPQAAAIATSGMDSLSLERYVKLFFNNGFMYLLNININYYQYPTPPLFKLNEKNKINNKYKKKDIRKKKLKYVECLSILNPSI